MARDTSEPAAQPERATPLPDNAERSCTPSAWPQTEARVSPASLAGLDEELLCYRVTLDWADAPSIWLIRESQSTDELLELALASRLLSQSEREDISQMQSVEAAGRRAIARVLLRTALSASVDDTIDPRDWVISHDAHGRPGVSHSGLERSLAFSVSHTDGLTVCVVYASDDANTRVNLGVDLEPITRTVNNAVVRKSLNAAERRLLQAELGDDQQQSFLRLWTLKEAWSKALGLGLQSDFSRAEFHCPAQCIELRSHHRSGVVRDRHRQGHWTFGQMKVFQSHWLAVAMQKDQ